MSRDEKILWATLLVLGIVITMPLYWFFKIWRE
jgi:hypothetical protein